MLDTRRIDLAHAAEFRLGVLAVSPCTRELVAPNGRREVLEPRVMQVLTALAQAEGGIVSRHDLTMQCWEGRVVGDDAINRVLSRLRRLEEGIAAGQFRVETITKVGYRLLVDGATPAPAAPPPPVAIPLARRTLLIGGGAVAGAAVLGLALWPRRDGSAPPPAPVAGLMQTGLTALSQCGAENFAAAGGMFRRVTELEPRYADGWGALALTYAAQSRYLSVEQVASFAARARAAIARAEALDPDNGYADAARGMLLPALRHFRAQEAAFRAGLAHNPDNALLSDALGMVLLAVGRIREAADDYDRTAAIPTPTQTILYHQLLSLWAAERYDDFDRALANAEQLFPLYYALWFVHFYSLLYGGRAREAIAFAENEEGRPINIPAAEFDFVAGVARAMVSRDAAAIDAVLAQAIERAHQGAGHAENAIQFASAFGRLDTAFAVADAYFFGRGFAVPAMRFKNQTGTQTRLDSRNSYILFLPSTAPMRRDPRFAPLVRAIGLERYWVESGHPPDYRRG